MNLLNEIEQVAKHSIGTAKNLPFGSYTSLEVYNAEQKSIFSQDWVFVCFQADVKNPGDYQTSTIAGEPIAVVHGKDGKLRALSNVCRHRGAVLLQDRAGSLKKNKISCTYHAWNYSDVGALEGIPFRGKVEINREEHCLPQFQLEVMHGLVFVSLNDEAPPLQERFKGIEKYLSAYQVENYLYSSGTTSENWDANWKLAMENFLEGYHFFAVHKETVEPEAPTKKVYYIEGHADWSISGGKQKDYPHTLLGMLTSKAKEVEYLTICLPPNFVFLQYDGYISWVRALPTGPSSCELSYGTVASFPFKESKYETNYAKKFFKEDRDICELVQQGMTSQRSKGGKLVELERAIVDFHQYLVKWLLGKDYSNLYQSEHYDKFKTQSLESSTSGRALQRVLK
ncbi:MAG: aromatic ring-hydroxylating dioxygenase subunit alpha [Spirochaetota bacterium]